MAQSGYGYDPLHGYYPQAQYAQYAHPSYPPYQAPTLSFPNGVVQTIVHNEPAPRDSYHPPPPPPAIPGLGLNFVPNATQWPGPWTHQQPSYGQERHAAAEEFRPSQTTYKSEEGEISEGEAEDLYEPRDAEIIADRSYMNRGAQVPAGFSSTTGRQMADNPPAAIPLGRDRSGSYSPYLSPQEIDRKSLSDSLNDQSNRVTPQISSQSSPNTNGTSRTASSLMPAGGVGATREQARGAILELWPHVRYQDYVDEGISERVVRSLFEELGLDMGAPSDATAAASGHEEKATSEAKDEPVHTDGNQQRNDSEESPTGALAKDKSEERKDRIARLLAAKNSKPSPSAAAVAPSTPTPAATVASASTFSSHTPVAKQQGPKKTQSEKSKLLYQKMEALRKARELEARGQKRPHPEELSRQNHQAKNKAVDSKVTSSFDTTTSNTQTVPREHTPGQTPSPNGQLPPSIPGLFLSSTPQPLHSIRALDLDRPASTSLVDSNPRPFKRPFGQTRKSRPFLIDVSDDEEDAEMDIDSPEQKAAQLSAKAPPPLKTSISIRSAPSFTNSGAATQQYSSPIGTPPGTGSDGSATRDLNNMTKKIEAMKKRIAEAEARRKAKGSQPDSPALAALNDESPGRCFGTITSKETIVPAPSSSIESQELSHATPPLKDQSPMTLPPLPEASLQGTPERRSRSRAASERLPLLEARRREQQLKLQLLQAQVANIQREIEQSLEEEEKLKVDVDMDSGSEQTQEQQATSLSKLSSPSSPLTDAMDIASISPQSNNTHRQNREATAHGVEESREEQQSSIIMAGLTGETPSNDGLVTSQAAGTAAVILNDAQGVAVQAAGSIQADVNTAVMAEKEQSAGLSEAGNSNIEDYEEGSDGYEPPDVELRSASKSSSRASTPFSPAPADLDLIPDADTRGFQEDTTELTAAQQISTVQQDAVSESGREVNQVSEGPAAPPSDTLQTTFVPYESPLRYFRAYRFHPEYFQTVSGGLRSLTYSNKIDVKQQICPDELAQRSCPRGSECEYQHFENMQAPDDQILLQLGAHGDFEEKRQQEYINGLRHLLTDFRNRKVKDFQTISQSIIDYRAQFLGDKSKILPLGGVTI